MKQHITIRLTDEEADLILEALEMDREIYLESARDAVADGSHELAVALSNAADRICTFRTRFQREIAGHRSRR